MEVPRRPAFPQTPDARLGHDLAPGSRARRRDQTGPEPSLVVHVRHRVMGRRRQGTQRDPRRRHRRDTDRRDVRGTRHGAVRV